jgi:DNA-binding NtrC family response regulator
MVRLYEEIAGLPVPILILAGEQECSIAALVQRGAFGYLHKSASLGELTITELKTMIHRAHESGTGNQALGSPKTQPKQPDRCGNLMGASAPMLAVYDLIQRVADLMSRS